MVRSVTLETVALAVGLALALGCLEWRVVRGNMGAVWNGYGAVGGTRARVLKAPMRYRVLVPWLVGWIPEPVRLWAYQGVKMSLVAGCLLLGAALLGRAGMALLAVLVAVTFEFDYWDGYAELLAVELILLGSPWSMALGGVVWGFSRETALLAPVLIFLASGWDVFACVPLVVWLAGPVALGAARFVQGPARLYCERWTLRVYNLPDLARSVERADVGPWLSLLWTGAVLAAAGVLLVAGWSGRVGGAWWRTALVAPVWIVAGWTMARVRETRVLLPSAVWMVAAVVLL